MQNYTATTGGTYKVNVTNANGCTKTSAGKVVTVNCREGIAGASESDSKLIIFPNPAHNVFTIKIDNGNMEDGAAQIEISNVLGQTTSAAPHTRAAQDLVTMIGRRSACSSADPAFRAVAAPQGWLGAFAAYFRADPDA